MLLLEPQSTLQLTNKIINKKNIRKNHLESEKYG